ncbi:hypothetical protein GCM10010245_37660 [Streptomyces spectabilis]|nr:hypothetical protein GCM10010245_37660 [Streptomyces spectabilis]
MRHPVPLAEGVEEAGGEVAERGDLELVGEALQIGQMHDLGDGSATDDAHADTFFLHGTNFSRKEWSGGPERGNQGSPKRPDLLSRKG